MRQLVSFLYITENRPRLSKISGVFKTAILLSGLPGKIIPYYPFKNLYLQCFTIIGFNYKSLFYRLNIS